MYPLLWEFLDQAYIVEIVCKLCLWSRIDDLGSCLAPDSFGRVIWIGHVHPHVKRAITIKGKPSVLAWKLSHHVAKRGYKKSKETVAMNQTAKAQAASACTRDCFALIDPSQICMYHQRQAEKVLNRGNGFKVVLIKLICNACLMLTLDDQCQTAKGVTNMSQLRSGDQNLTKVHR